jgi:hypothetical protein
MDRQPPSYWIMVFVFGPAAGIFCWLFWSAWMAVASGHGFLRILFGGGLMFGLWMGLTFTAMNALLFVNVRREAPGGDLAVIRDRLLRISKKHRLRVADDAGTYLRLKPSWGLKPSFSYAQAWIGEEQTILTGPWRSYRRSAGNSRRRRGSKSAQHGGVRSLNQFKATDFAKQLSRR